MIDPDDLGVDKGTLAWTGHWWLPGSPDNKLPGVLLPTGDRGPSLELMGGFPRDRNGDQESRDIIHGTTPKAESVTLHKCTVSGMSDDGRGRCRTCYDVELVVTGEHFPSVDALKFQHLRIQYSTLVHWVGLPLIDEKDLDRGTGRPMTVKVRANLRQRMYAGDGFILEIYYGPCWETTGSILTLNIHPGAHISLHWDTPRAFPETLAVISAIRDFLAFGTCTHTSVETIEARPVRSTLFGRAFGMFLFHRSLAGTSKQEYSFRALFSLEDVQSNLEAVLGGWFQRRQVLQPVIDLHLAPIYNPQMAAESQFLAAVQALEAFHRRTWKTQDLPEDQHSARMAEVLAGAPEHYREWLSEKLRYSNELGLRRRIKSLFDEFKDILERFKIERNAFAATVYNTRNYLTHYDQALADKAAKGRELQQLIFGMQLLLDVCLLHACGVERSKIASLAERRHGIFFNRDFGKPAP